MREVYELDVYQLSEELSDMIWEDFDQWQEKAQRTIGYQIIRAADSIAANLAEGFGRYSIPDRKRFYVMSRDQARVAAYKELICQLGPKLNAFIKSTRKQSHESTQHSS